MSRGHVVLSVPIRTSRVSFAKSASEPKSIILGWTGTASPPLQARKIPAPVEFIDD